jgi:hypothetical protein
MVRVVDAGDVVGVDEVVEFAGDVTVVVTVVAPPTVEVTVWGVPATVTVVVLEQALRKLSEPMAAPPTTSPASFRNSRLDNLPGSVLLLFCSIVL